MHWTARRIDECRRDIVGLLTARWRKMDDEGIPNYIWKYDRQLIERLRALGVPVKRRDGEPDD